MVRVVHRWVTVHWKVTIHGQGSTQMGDHPVEGYNTWSGLVHRWVTIQWKVTIHGQG